MAEITSYPLTWPDGWKRPRSTESARFGNYSIAEAVRKVLDELRIMGYPDYCVIISTNLELRRDGLPYSNQKQPDDKGASVWWKKPKDHNYHVIALAQYDKIEHNIYAIGKTIEAMRGIRRWGGGEVLERTFTGFQALPPPDNWRDTLQVGPNCTLDEVEEKYKRLRKSAHPDCGGTNEQFLALQIAIGKARKELS